MTHVSLKGSWGPGVLVSLSRRTLGLLVPMILLILIGLPVKATDWGYRWPPGTTVTIEDRTGNAAWQDAFRQATVEWNQGSPVPLNFTLESSFDGYCRFDGPTVSVCRHDMQHNWLARTWAEPDASNNFAGAYTEVNDQRENSISQALKLSVACHEEAHVLGLAEQYSDPHSCTYNGADAFPCCPDANDFAELRSMYSH